MTRTAFTNTMGVNNVPYVYKEVLDATSYPKVEVSNFNEIAGSENLMVFAGISESGTFTGTGYYINMYDYDSATYYRLLKAVNGSHSLIIDLNNSQVIDTLILNFDVISGSPLTTLTASWKISTDGVTYTTLTTDTANNQTLVKNYQFPSKEFRFLKLDLTITAAGVSGYIDIKEVQIIKKRES